VVVTNEGDGSVSLLDARTGTVRRTLRLGFTPLALAVDARAGRAVVVGWPMPQGHEDGAAQVSTIDTRASTVRAPGAQPTATVRRISPVWA